MASRSLGTLTLDLIAKIGGFEQGMDRAARTADRKGREISAAARKHAKETEEAWASVGTAIGAVFSSTAIGAVFSSIAVGAVFQKVIAETKQAEQEQAQLAAVLKSTGNAAGYSQERLNEMADAMSRDLGIGAGDINQAQTVLLAFTNITGEKLPAALQAAADHSKRTGSDIKASAEIMGRALDVPSVGMASLQKQGFKFSESQIEAARKLERTGQIAQAQQIVLDALNESYGGAAAAARDTFGGALAALQETINDLLTGDSGSMAKMKKSVEDLNSTLSDEQTRAAFQTMISWMTDFSTSVIRGTANLVAFINTKNKLSVIMGTDEFGKLKTAAQDYSYQLTELTSKAERFQEALRRDPDDKNMQRMLNNVRKKITEVSGKAMQASQALKDFADLQTPAASTATVTAPDLTPRAVGSVNLKDGDKKGGGASASGKSQAEKDAEAADRYIQKLKEQAEQVREMTSLERLQYDIREGAVQFGTQAQFQEAERLAILADFTKSGLEADKERQRLQEEGKRLTEQVRTPLEQMRDDYARINQLLDDGVISAETYKRALDKARENSLGMSGDVDQWIRGDVKPLSGGMFDQQTDRYTAEAQAENERYEAQLKRLQDAYGGRAEYIAEQYLIEETLAREHADRLNQIDMARNMLMLSTAESGFASLAESMKGSQGKATGAYKALFTVSKAFAIAQATLGLSNAISSAMTLPWPANLAAAASAAGYMGQILSSVNAVTAGFADGGYTGPGGKYDVAGLVHKGEGVLSQRDIGAMGGPSAFEAFRASLHTGYADGGYVSAAQPGYNGESKSAPAIVNIIEDNSKAGKVEQKTDDMDRQIINVFVRNIRSGGDAAEALQGAYGLSRAGR